MLALEGGVLPDSGAAVKSVTLEGLLELEGMTGLILPPHYAYTDAVIPGQASLHTALLPSTYSVGILQGVKEENGRRKEETYRMSAGGGRRRGSSGAACRQNLYVAGKAGGWYGDLSR